MVEFLLGFAGLELEIGGVLGIEVDLMEVRAAKPRVVRELAKGKVPA